MSLAHLITLLYLSQIKSTLHRSWSQAKPQKPKPHLSLSHIHTHTKTSTNETTPPTWGQSPTREPRSWMRNFPSPRLHDFARMTPPFPFWPRTLISPVPKTSVGKNAQFPSSPIRRTESPPSFCRKKPFRDLHSTEGNKQHLPLRYLPECEAV